MASISTNEFKNGLKLIVEGDPCEILEHEFHKPGKGQAVMRVKFKNLKSNRVWEKTYKTGESLEKADLENIPMQFLYESGEEVVMMNNNSFDQETFSKEYNKLDIKIVKEFIESLGIKNDDYTQDLLNEKIYKNFKNINAEN